jgi:hypothetical protein
LNEARLILFRQSTCRDDAMSCEHWLEVHRVWLELLTSVGTVGAVVVALYLASKADRELRKEKLSGLTIDEVTGDGTAFIANNTRVDLSFSLDKSDLLNPQTELACYQPFSALSSLSDVHWNPVKKQITLSPGERLPIHLAILTIEKTYVARIALRVVTPERTRYWVYRFAGVKAKYSESISKDTHPHLKWVLEFGANVPIP